MWLIVQEAGSSSEASYPHLFDTLREARAARAECAEGSYRTSPPFRVPERIARQIRANREFSYDVMALLEGALDSLMELDYPEGE